MTALIAFAAYLLTLAPDVTLEDSGELAVGSFYAGVPHPPGYPIWTIITYLFTVLVPISNIAFRVALASAASASLACGLLALMVSRGSALMMENMSNTQNRSSQNERDLALVSGVVAGLLLAFNGFFWSQAVIVEVYCLGVLSLMSVLCCLMRWMYMPEQRRYLYMAAFLFGISITNHQSLLLGAMGLEVAILAVDRRLGRDLFWFNGGVYLLGLLLKSSGGLVSFENNVPLFTIFNGIGVGSLAVALWFSLSRSTGMTKPHAKSSHHQSNRGLILGYLGTNLIIWFLWITASDKSFPTSDFAKLMLIINFLYPGLTYAFFKLTGRAERIFVEWKALGWIAFVWMIGAGFYFYMPITSMTNPPMNWG
jgi:hypothetical protein